MPKSTEDRYLDMAAMLIGPVLIILWLMLVMGYGWMASVYIGGGHVTGLAAGEPYVIPWYFPFVVLIVLLSPIWLLFGCLSFQRFLSDPPFEVGEGK